MVKETLTIFILHHRIDSCVMIHRILFTILFFIWLIRNVLLLKFIFHNWDWGIHNLSIAIGTHMNQNLDVICNKPQWISSSLTYFLFCIIYVNYSKLLISFKYWDPTKHHMNYPEYLKSRKDQMDCHEKIHKIQLSARQLWFKIFEALYWYLGGLQGYRYQTLPFLVQR